MAEGMLKTVDDGNWREFLEAPLAVLTLSVSTCPVCSAWNEELESWLADEPRWIGARFGEVILDSPAVADFKRDNEWLDEIPGLPFTAIFVEGEPRMSLAGGGVTRLERRLESLELPRHLISEIAEAVPPHEENGATAPRTAHGA
jgi:hypothetical protein